MAITGTEVRNRRAAVTAALVASLTWVGCSSDQEATGGGGSGGKGGSSDGGGATGGSGGSGGGVGTGGGIGTGGSPDAAPDGAAGMAGSGLDGGAGSPADASDAADADPGCVAGQKPCGALCVELDDPAFGCTASGCSPCPFAGATTECVAGACVFDGCQPGHADCNGVTTDGCEIDVQADPRHCGACGNTCALPHATATCTAGACAVASCSAGFGDCDGNAANGCEANLLKDPAHCGTCPKQCNATPGASAVCNNGTCGEKACSIGLMDCDEDFNNGCETNLGSDQQNCGFCGNTCNLPNANSSCTGGTCTVTQCVGGFSNCDGLHANGCETDTGTNSLHCASCNRGCVRAGASSVRCEAGLCHALCDTRGDCVSPAAPLPDDGCETDIQGDPTNCGTCANVCTVPSGTPGCTNGKCSISDCPGTLGDCDGDVSNGCETELQTAEDDCGECGRACASTGVASRVCSGGLCVSGCSTGFSNCGTPAAPATDDGCETPTSSDVDNCGGCGRICASTNVLSRACEAGRCTSSCQLGFGNCRQLASPALDDGCEADVTNVTASCGSCANDCAQQGGGGSGLRCGAPQAMLCGCAGNDGRCRLSGAQGTCNAANGQCVCGGTTCQPGEACQRVGGNDQCSCNAGSPCPTGRVCCETPAGCLDLQTDPASCGACGRACPPGFACDAAACKCAGAASCNAGSSGSCEASSGLCSCGAGACAAGQRCQPSGACG